MRYYVEKALRDFEFWGGAKSRAERLTSEELDKVEEHLDELLHDDYTETDVNDLFWYDFDKVCDSIGLMYKDDCEVYDSESWTEHIYGLLQRKCPEILDIYWEDFQYYGDLDSFNSDGEVLEAWGDYVDNEWLDHAESVLEEEFPEVSENERSSYACEQWQNAKSDEWNINEFKKQLMYEAHNLVKR